MTSKSQAGTSQRTMQRFQSLPNFRSLLEEFDAFDAKHPQIYRSSRPDFLTQEDLEEYRKLGIRSIIDCRAATEYRKASGSKLLDHYYPLYKVKIPRTGEVPINDVLSIPLNVSDSGEHLGKHFLIDFFKLNYIWMTYMKASLWFRIYSMIYLIYDIIFRTGFKYFVRAFAKEVLNKDVNGLGGQYLDMINHSKASIYSALKILSDPENVPAMINCAHGKDRTGILSALILSIMGKSKKQIVADYTLSIEGLSSVRDRVHFEIVTWLHMSPEFTKADEKNMLLLLDYIDEKWGSVSGYLQHIGFTLEDQDKLRKNLTRPVR